ncbi:hypothetical protein [Haloarcula vallismortis]|uniref:hypothetical protein n=1 Tax=Haloarcula vallismortis TaxID=28442 RepID=UPI00373FE023
MSYQFGIGYEDDIETVRAIIENAARDLDHVSEKPAPTARVSDLASTAIILTGRIWIPNERRNRLASVRAAFIQQVTEDCHAEGIDLSETNQYELSGDIGVHGSAGPTRERTE